MFHGLKSWFEVMNFFFSCFTIFAFILFCQMFFHNFDYGQLHVTLYLSAEFGEIHW